MRAFARACECPASRRSGSRPQCCSRSARCSRAGSVSKQRPALDAAVRGDPGDRGHRPDARHPAARPRPLRAGDDHAHDDHRHADPERPRRPAARGDRARPARLHRLRARQRHRGHVALDHAARRHARRQRAAAGRRLPDHERRVDLGRAAGARELRARQDARHPERGADRGVAILRSSPGSSARRSSGGASSRSARAPRPRTPRACA